MKVEPVARRSLTDGVVDRVRELIDTGPTMSPPTYAARPTDPPPSAISSGPS